MKKIILYITGALIGTLIGVSANAQNGLENIIVERYYVSNPADAALSSGTLPTGSVTYRFYADLLPGYKLQAVYGVNNHPLKFVTTTTFFNNEDNGTTTPSFNFAQADDNTTMLDSWLSVGAACNGQFGVLKTEDNGVNNVVNADGILANNSASAGIPALRIRDVSGSDSYLQVQPASGLVNFLAQGNVNASFNINSNGTGSVRFTTNGTTGAEQMRVSHTASAVNYVQVTGAATTATPVISAQGSDTNISLAFQAKGSNGLFFRGGAGANIFGINGTSGTNRNYLTIDSVASGSSPYVSVAGSDTNIDLTLTPKGTGRVTTSATLVAGLISGGTF